jgi:hypothetical protein
MRIYVLATIILSCMLAATASRADENDQPDVTSQAAVTCDTNTADGQQTGNDAHNQQDDPGSAYMNQVELRS